MSYSSAISANSSHSEFKKVGTKGFITTLIILIIGALVIFLLNDASAYINWSYLIFLTTVCMLINSLGKKIPLRELTIFFTALQYLFSPSLDYQILGRYTWFHMEVSQETYFGYIFPAFFAFAIGLFLPLTRRRETDAEFINRIKAEPKKNRQIGLVLICIGMLFKYFPQLMGSIPALNFIITLLSLLRFIGVLYLWLSDSKYSKLIIGAVLFEATISVFREAIFIQLIILMVFMYSYYSLLNKPNKLKIIILGLIAGVLLFILQSIKADYRKTIWRVNPDADIFPTLSNSFSNKYLNNSNSRRTLLYTAASVNVRLNQGWVMETIMRNLPVKRPFLDGAVFWEEFYGLFLPRFIVQDKAVVQSSDKFQRFAGYKIKNYTIAVGIFGDGYGNFGIKGGITFCFFVALFFNISIFYFYRFSRKRPSLFLWSIFIFFYLIRAGDDFYIITNWIIKSSMLLFFIFQIFKKHLVKAYQPLSK